MSKVRKSSRPLKEVKESSAEKFNLEKIIPSKYHIVLAIVTIILLYLIFLNPLYFGGKTFQSGDIVASESMIPAVEKEGFSLWNPYIFCGMPAYALSTDFPWFNLVTVGISELRNGFAAFFAVKYTMWTFYLILLGITSFLLMRYLTKNTLVSLFTAIATSFSTGLIVFLFIGHVTKLTSLCVYPLIFLMLLRMQKKVTLLDFLILIIALQLSLQGFHVQIIFYMLFAVAIYFIFYFIYAIIKKLTELRNNIVKSAAAFIIAAVIAVLIHSDSITQVYEYTKYSTRGTESLVEQSRGESEQSESEFYKYHTDWSFSPGEILTFIVPSYYGFGNSKYDGPLTQGQEVEVNTYFGQMPFVDVAMYMGVVIFFLGLFAIFTGWKEPYIKFLTLLAAIALLLSFGKNLPILFDLLFYHFPNFNKFRVPSMALVLVQLTFPVLAGLGLKKIIDLRNEKEQRNLKLVRNSAIVFSVIFLFSLILNSSVIAWFTGRVNEYAASVQTANPNLARQFQALAEYSSQMFSTDLILAFLFLSVTFWASHLYINKKLSGDALTVILIVIVVIDLWRIDSRGEKYQDAQDKKNLFEEPGYVSAIKSKADKEPFRILNLKQDGSLGSINSNSNFNAYFLLEDFYGYSGIKPRAYQDIIDIAGPANPTLWRMLNVKYIITDKEIQFPGLNFVQNTGTGVVYENSQALPRMYFVNSVQTKKSLDLLNMIKENSFDPKETAFIPDQKLSVDKPDSTTSVNITKYLDNQIDARVNASGNNFLFLGTTYLPTGWKCSIDGNSTTIYQANHGFMGIVVPKGSHLVEFEYAPVSFYLSKYTSLGLSSLVMISLVVVIFFKRKTSGKQINF